MMGAAGWFSSAQSENPEYPMAAMIAVAVVMVCIDILAPENKVKVFSGTFFGIAVGLLITYGLSFVAEVIVDLYVKPRTPDDRALLLRNINFATGITCCYLAISFILQTKEDVRFIIPYVEFAKQTRGARPMLVDTSVLIDGRILEIAQTGIIESRLIVPRFVLLELQTIADHGDKLKRARGKRGLEILNKLQSNKKVEVILYEVSPHHAPEAEGADEKLLVLAKELSGRVLTNDANLKKVAEVRGVDVINLNEVAEALRPVVLPGEKMSVRLVKPGEDPGQGVGFLEDGTMVVVKDGRGHINEDVEFVVTNVLQNATGRMVFGQIGDVPVSAPTPSRRGAPHGRPRGEQPSPTQSPTRLG